MMDGSGQDNAGKARDTGLAESLQQAQEKLRADEALLRQFIEHVPAAVAMFDKEMHYIMASRRWMTDYHLGERNIIGLSHYEVFPEAPQRWREIHQRCLAGNVERCEEDRFERQDGTVDWLSWDIRPWYAADGSVGGIIMLTEVITERKRVEEELRQSEERFRLLANLAPVGVYQTDAQGRCRYVNERWCEMAGLRPEEALGDGWIRGIHPEDREKICAEWKQMVDSIGRWGLEYRFLNAEGRTTWVLGFVKPFYNAAGELLGYLGANQDITTIRQAANEILELNQSLQRKVEELETLFATVPISIAIAEDPQCRVIRANSVFAKILEISASDNASMSAPPGERPENFRVVLDGKVLPPEELPMQVAAATGNPVSDVEFDVVQDHGRLVRMMGNATPLFDEQGRPRGSIGAFADITALKQAQAALRQSEQRLSMATQAAKIGIWNWDLLKGELTWTARSCELLGLPLDAEQAYPVFLNSVHPEDRQRVDDSLKQTITENREYNTEYRTTWPDGSIHWLHATGHTVYDEAGRLTGLHGVAIDVTGRKQTEEALRQSEAELREAQHLARVGSWTWTQETDTVTWSEELYRIVGRDPKLPAPTYKERVQLYTPESFARLNAAVDQALESGAAYELELELVRPDGTSRWITGRGEAQRDASGRVVMLRGTAVDITERKRAAEALSEANVRLAEADRRKDEFLAMLAHELRNPLAPIRNAVQILRTVGSDRPILQRQHEIIDRQVTHMGCLLGDLLDVSRITSGKIELKRRSLPLHDVLTRAVEIASPLIETGLHSLHNVPPSPRLWIEGDYDRLIQIVGNLLSNAAKYTDTGGEIWLSATREGDQAVIRVQDNGIGIAPELLPHIFELFTQANRSLGRSQGGLGIGLTMVRKLVQMHGGTIEAHSEGLGKGSEFIIRLPALPEVASGEVAEEEPHEPLEEFVPRRILVVDDVIDTARSLAELLELWGHQVSVAYDGPSTLAEVRFFHPDVVLLDIGLPVMDGYEVVRLLRSEHGRSLKIVALTGYGQEYDRQKAHESGFDEHMVKPVDLDALKMILRTGAARRPAP